MAAIGTLRIPRMRVSALEIENPANPYTFETVARLRAEYGLEAELYFIVGSDSFEEMHTWRRPDLILSLSNLIVAARPGHRLSNDSVGWLPLVTGPTGQTCRDLSSAGPNGPPTVIDLTGDQMAAVDSVDRREAGVIFLTDYIRVDVSSTEIRRRAAKKLDIRGMVPQGVAEYIAKYDLYKASQPADVQ
jgi:nicotinate-nucleotide adenylyltransferase